MKSIGIVRNVDELGRLVVPKEMRKALDIDYNDPVEITLEADRIVIKKYVAGCIFCGGESEISIFKGKRICTSCLKEMAK